MRTFRRMLRSALCLLCCVAILSIIVITPISKMEASDYRDASLRRDLAGSIDTIILGASHALSAFDPNVLDEALNCSSYNLSGTLMTAHSKLYLLEKELERNPVETVVLEVSYNMLSRSTEEEYGEGDAVTVARLDSLPEKLMFMARYISLDNCMNVYSRLLVSGMIFWKTVLLGGKKSSVNRDAKGFKSMEPADISIVPEKVQSQYGVNSLDVDYIDSEVEALREQIELCHSRGVEVIIAVTPVSNKLLWQYSGWDAFRVWLKAFSEENGCACYDFNLLKDRYELFNDSDSFYNNDHMSKIGAKNFCQVFADVVKRAKDGEDISDRFYDTYEQLIEHSPYMQYLNS